MSCYNDGPTQVEAISPMCAECGCQNVERFGVQPLQAPPTRPVRLVEADENVRVSTARGPETMPGESAGPAHAHEHVHADGTRHSHPHDHPHTWPHDHSEARAHAHDHAAAADAGTGAVRPALIEVHQPILARNARLAERNRGYLKAKGVCAINLLSSPGAGKTTLIERTVAALGGDVPVAVIVGDLATANDAARIRQAGAPVVQITTGTVCHLDAEMVARGLEQLDLDRCQWLLVENVGNLVCPADFDLGEELRVVLVSVTEGEDKPLKYPPMFRSADVVVVTKLDLADAAGADLGLLRRNLRATAPGARHFELSARTGDGMAAWMDWLRQVHPTGPGRSPVPV